MLEEDRMDQIRKILGIEYKKLTKEVVDDFEREFKYLKRKFEQLVDPDD